MVLFLSPTLTEILPLINNISCDPVVSLRMT